MKVTKATKDCNAILTHLCSVLLFEEGGMSNQKQIQCPFWLLNVLLLDEFVQDFGTFGLQVSVTYINCPDLQGIQLSKGRSSGIDYAIKLSWSARYPPACLLSVHISYQASFIIPIMLDIKYSMYSYILGAVRWCYLILVTSINERVVLE